MKKAIWCFFNKRTNYDKNESLTALVYKCIWLIENCPNAKVSITQYEILITTSSTIIKLWNENRWYAWLNSGEVNGRKFEKISPSTEAIYDFKKCLEDRGYIIAVKPPKDFSVIQIYDVKC